MDASISVQGGAEVARLKREIRTLKIQNEDLLYALADSKDELDASLRTMNEISSLRKPFSQPPPEILQMIFERAIPPHFFIDSSFSFLPNSLWCQVQEQKHALLNVCRAWYRIGLPFLYANVSIRRIPQLLNLLRTLSNSSPNLNLKEIIRTVEILCPIPVSYGHRFEQQLQVLFAICPRISSCSFVSQVSPLGLPPSVLFCALVLNVTHLKLNEGVELDTLRNILQLVSPYIVSLSLYSPSAVRDKSITIPDINFNYLEDLSLWAGGDGSAFIHKWNMPCLRRLTFDGNFGDEELKYFCDLYGATLQYLHFTRGYFCTWALTPGFPRFLQLRYSPIDFPDLSKSCPVLEHLVLPPFTRPLPYSGIKWLDVWVSENCPGELEQVRSEIQGANWPALKGVRLLPYSPPDNRHDLPLILPPTLVPTPMHTFSIQLSNLVIRHDVGEIRYIGPPRTGYLDNDDWDAFKDPENSDDEREEGNADKDSSDSSDGSYIAGESDSEESDFSYCSIDWNEGSPNQFRATIADWELENDSETDFLG
ncbi:hypothetical protein GALMADRAFT_132480 [Galerina marginata CBS 339.88]|uniref:F-box domain-containing protein n=1 Tax=Galerina marginata (strain CBS 339.88) TaxID=685588 RepID=A0A067TRL8_GALM3|nr:hypothetical protein GALMADRAFT_132480 [Galerina marginata CBS 339.88]